MEGDVASGQYNVGISVRGTEKVTEPAEPHFQQRSTSLPSDAGWYSNCPCRPSDPKSTAVPADRKSTRLNSSHMSISYAVFCLKKKKHNNYICLFRHSDNTITN